MNMKGLADLKQRIKSIKSTRQITKAMEMVAAAKMRKATSAVLKSRDYANTLINVLQNLKISVSQEQNPFFAKNDSPRELVILFTSNRGLCGAFNNNIIRLVLRYLKETKKEIEFITIGRKGEQAVRRLGKKIIASSTEAIERPSLAEIAPIAKIATEEFLTRNYSKITLIYSFYFSALSQKPTIETLLPFEKKIIEEENPAGEIKQKGILFEPNAKVVFDALVPRAIEFHLYQTLLESAASEHSARMLSMRNATSAADDMIEDFTLAYNQIRQSNITKELAEIASGANALE